MIKIYTSKDSFENYEILIDNESFFNINVSAKTFSELSIQVMKDIDQAELLDRKTGKIETPYGITGIQDLSTGCKTVLNYIFIKENFDKYPCVKAIDATECGWNAIDKLFDIIEYMSDEDIAIIIEHNNDLYECKDREYCINDDEIINTLLDL